MIYIAKIEDDKEYQKMNKGRTMKETNKNLIPLNLRSPEERREIARKGGIKSGESRRRKREQIEAIKLRDIAMKEERESNLKILNDAIDLVNEAKSEAENELLQLLKDFLQEQE